MSKEDLINLIKALGPDIVKENEKKRIDINGLSQSEIIAIEESVREENKKNYNGKV